MSVTPRRVRWYATLAPMHPPPTMTTSAVRFISPATRCHRGTKVTKPALITFTQRIGGTERLGSEARRVAAPHGRNGSRARVAHDDPRFVHAARFDHADGRQSRPSPPNRSAFPLRGLRGLPSYRERFFFVRSSCLRAFVPSCLRVFVSSCFRSFVVSWFRGFAISVASSEPCLRPARRARPVP